MFIEKPGFKYLPHTADAKFVAEGKDIEEAFKNAAFAMFNIIVDTDKVEKKIKKVIEIEGNRELSLLYDFLEELLVYLDADGFLLADLENLNIQKEGTDEQPIYKLKALAYGDTYTKENKHDVQGNIKAVTYNDMEIKKSDNKVEITVVIDL
jgi:SHS2 domain-containing protein